MTNEELGELISEITCRYYEKEDDKVLKALYPVKNIILKSILNYDLDGTQIIELNYNLFVSSIISALAPLSNEDRELYFTHLQETLGYIYRDLQNNVVLDEEEL